MKNTQPKNKSTRLIEKFDKQLRDLLTAELNAAKEARLRFLSPMNNRLVA